MAWFPSAVFAGVTSFVATNIDDIFLLTIFYSWVNASFRPRHIIAGQYLGFVMVLGISALGLVGAMVLPREWIGLLGIRADLRGRPQSLPAPRAGNKRPYAGVVGAGCCRHRPGIASIPNPHTYGVAAGRNGQQSSWPSSSRASRSGVILK